MAQLNGRVYLTGRVVDATSLEPLPGASVAVTNRNGLFLGDGVAANNDGYWGLNSMLYNGNLLTFTNIGYKQAAIDPSELDFYSEIALERDSEELEPVIVTPGKKKSAPWLLLGGLLLLLTLKR